MPVTDDSTIVFYLAGCQRRSMRAVQQHYDEAIGEIYSWTLGDFDKRVASSAELLRKYLGFLDARSRRALDLGCGTGVQTLALTALGYSVDGIDCSTTMLAEYSARTNGLNVRAHLGDIAQFELQTSFDAAVCLGDTVSHLQDWSQVATMFACIAHALTPGGTLVLASRDHSKVYVGDERFLLIRADSERTFTCFVEDAGERIRITDIVHERTPGLRPMRTSSYYKLRVSPKTLAKALTDAGLVLLAQEQVGDVHLLIGKKIGVKP